MRDYVVEAEKDGETSRSVRADVPPDEGVAAFMTSEARRRGMTRTACVEWMTRRIAQMGG